MLRIAQRRCGFSEMCRKTLHNKMWHWLQIQRRRIENTLSHCHITSPSLQGFFIITKLKWCSTSDCPSHRGRSLLHYGKREKNSSLLMQSRLCHIFFFISPTTMTDSVCIFSRSCCSDECLCLLPCSFSGVFKCDGWRCSHRRRMWEKNNIFFFRGNRISFAFSSVFCTQHAVHSVTAEDVCVRHALSTLLAFAMTDIMCVLVLNYVFLRTNTYSTGNLISWMLAVNPIINAGGFSAV